MSKFFKYSFSIVLLTTALATAFTLPGWAAGPPNIVTNGDFTDGLNHWTAGGTHTWTLSGQQVTVTIPYDIQGYNYAYLAQCIKITHQPDGNNWTLSASGNIVGPGALYAWALFDSSSDCSIEDLEYVEIAPGSTHSFIYDATGALSVKVGVMCHQLLPGVSTVCTADDIYLGGENATAVTLVKLNARSQEFKPIFLLFLSLVLFGLVVILRRVVRARNSPPINEIG